MSIGYLPTFWILGGPSWWACWCITKHFNRIQKSLIFATIRLIAFLIVLSLSCISIYTCLTNIDPSCSTWMWSSIKPILLQMTQILVIIIMMQFLGSFSHNLGLCRCIICSKGTSSPTYTQIVDLSLALDCLTIRVINWLLLLHHHFTPGMRLLTLTLDLILIVHDHVVSLGLAHIISLHLRVYHILFIDEL